jgi:hypothetical protein
MEQPRRRCSTSMQSTACATDATAGSLPSLIAAASCAEGVRVPSSQWRDAGDPELIAVPTYDQVMFMPWSTTSAAPRCGRG